MSESTREVHYVTFYSPGTMVPETTTRPISVYSRELAVAMAGAVVERHGARPYGFQFFTQIEAGPVATDRGPMLVEPREAARTGMYYLGGTVLTLAEVEARADPRDEILLSNMRANGWGRVVEVVNGYYRSVHLFQPGDAVVDERGAIVAVG